MEEFPPLGSSIGSLSRQQSFTNSYNGAPNGTSSPANKNRLSAAAIVAGNTNHADHQQTLARIIQQGNDNVQADQKGQLNSNHTNLKDIPTENVLNGVKLNSLPGSQPVSINEIFGKQQSNNADVKEESENNGPIPIPPAGTDTKYGLYALVDILRMTDNDTSMFSLGYDLMSLGLNFNSGDSLSESFMSPFAARPTIGAESQFKLPSFYNLQHPPPQPMTKIASFSDETLFYIFYAMPRETLQEIAAQELYNRNWRFHKDLKLWLSKDINAETVKGPGGENGVFIFFDPSTWSRVKKEWVVYYEQLEERHVANEAN